MNNYIEYDWYRNNNYLNGNKYNSNSMSLDNPQDGFEKGNIFKNLYNEYKGYQPAKLKATNEREQKLYNISAMCFAAHELNLYLDLNPNDQSAFMLFMDYERKVNNMVEEYEKMYGPLNVDSSEMKSFTWSTNNWPWEVENV